jgi:uncharacterized membrane protein
MIRTRDQLILQGLWAIWLCILLIPILFQIGELELTAVRMNLLSICHQKTERFFAFNSYLPLVCSRCMGIYLGLFIFGFFRWRQAFWLSIALIILPILADKIVEHATILPIGNNLRFISGLVTGLGFSGLIYFLQLNGKKA